MLPKSTHTSRLLLLLLLPLLLLPQLLWLLPPPAASAPHCLTSRAREGGRLCPRNLQEYAARP